MSEFKKITEDDYIKMRDIFAIWLCKKKKKMIDDLTEKKQKKKFKKFCKKYNKKKLDGIFYEPERIMQKYKDLLKPQNQIKKQDNNIPENKQNLTMEDFLGLKDDPDLFAIEKKTKQYDFEIPLPNNTEQQGLREPIGYKTEADLLYDEELERESMIQQKKYERKKFNKWYKDELEQILPAKEKGKEAMLEKKKLLNQKINGAKDESGVDEFNEDYLLGGSDSFAAAKRREQIFQQKRDKKQAVYQNQRSQHQQDLFDKYREKEERAMQQALQNPNTRFK